MQAAFMDRSSTVVREKRGLASSSVDDGPDKKRPALSSVIVEALKVDSLQKLCSSLEPVLRKVVSEEVERALSKLSPTKLTGSGRSSPKYLEAAVGRNLQLCFRSKLSLPLFTGGKVEGEQGGAIHIVLMDADTGQVVTAGPESLVKLDVVVLEGDFNDEDDSTWTQEEFDSHVVKEREGKRPLLAGDLQVLLKDGVGTLGELMFTDNSSWIRSRKFRLGLKVASDHCEGIRIREAKTEAFTVKDHRGELYKKHYPPALHDEVWRLEKIGKDGSFHRRLNRAGIYTVEDFLRLVVRDSQRLRNILGSGMSNKMWEILVEHARTCVLSGKLFVYFPDDVRSVAVVFNNIYELTGLIANGEYYAVDSLSENQKVYVDGLVTKAYDNWMHVVEYDDKSLFGGKEDESVEAAQTHTQTDPQAYPDMVHQQQTLPTLSVQCPLDQPSVDSCLNMGGYINTLAASLPVQSHSGNFSSPSQFCGQSFPLQDQLGTTSQLVQPPGHNHQPHSFSMLGCHGFGSSAEEGCFPEEKIDMRSIENEDMQHLLHFINMGGHGHTPASVTEDGYPHSSGKMLNPSPNYGLESEGSCSSAKAVAGWLKLKAALKWGIFIQQRAAERRAHLVELEDT